MLNRITPIILTYNEAPNIARTLERLQWARQIIIVDSYSTDDTLRLIARFPQTRVFQRAFDSHENQWNYALAETRIDSEWVLALDADYLLPQAFVEELKELKPMDGVGGYVAKFVYCVNGRPLRGSAYPPVTVLYRKQGARYRQDGHTQRIVVAGRTETLVAPIMHDDRKPLGHWLRAQDRYLKLEAEKLRQADQKQLSVADRIRRMRFPAPFIMFLYCLFIKGGVLDGRAGIYYAFQRMLAESLLALYLIEADFASENSRTGELKNSQTQTTPRRALSDAPTDKLFDSLIDTKNNS